MQIIDTFLFSEPHEKEVLLIKLILGGDYISEWIIVENDYTFQGEYKGLFARHVIDSDQRFAPYRDRIHIISAQNKHPPIDYTLADVDTQGMNSERRQRSLAREYIIHKYQDDTWVLLSDADEALDLTSDPNHLFFLLEKLSASKDGLVCVPRRRFWYDFDNLWLALRATPMTTVKRIRQAEGEMGMGFLRSDNIGAHGEWKYPLLFEYSYCYPKEAILRKYRTFPHGGMTNEEILQSMRCNHIPISSLRGKKLDLHQDLWMEKVALTPQNSPKYVREHLQSLQTHVVDSNYQQNRLADYPFLYTWKHRTEFAVKQAIKKLFKAIR
ncbi:hypothetical protein [Runella aurantiaca]|uniref:Glycosyl transferase family 17 n=1 Tax=Runella aurantiaca TaxID=2282308 RepID=A0A369IE57_9BACT|nr:hypothetical protein [Runella aurantiaca]RDB07130.1 hypothetical protein DVG78_03645 [Runella aurantiaca]